MFIKKGTLMEAINTNFKPSSRVSVTDNLNYVSFCNNASFFYYYLLINS